MTRNEKISYLHKIMADSINKCSSETALATIMYANGIDIDESRLNVSETKSKIIEYVIDKKENWKKKIVFYQDGTFMYAQTTDHHGNTYYDDKSHAIVFESKIDEKQMQKLHGNGKVTKISKISIEKNESVENEDLDNDRKEKKENTGDKV